ncbi:MAG TPA: hypothetical protein VIM69_13185 [Opitutaceae bacterium]
MSRGIEQFFSDRFVIGFPEQRLAYLAETIVEKRAEYCVVLHQKRQRYLGTFRIADVAATQPAQSRILLDLITDEKFPTVLPQIDSEALHNVLVKEEKGAVVVLDHEDEFLGLVTLESYAMWGLRQYKRRTGASRDAMPLQSNVFPFEELRPEDRRRDA